MRNHLTLAILALVGIPAEAQSDDEPSLELDPDSEGKGGSLGDDNAGFFEGKAFDLFRGPQGKALAAEDRAAEASARADLRDTLAGIDSDDGDDGPPAVDEPGTVSQVVTARGPAPIRDRKGREHARKHVKATKKIAGKQADHHRRLRVLEAHAAMNENGAAVLEGGLDKIAILLGGVVNFFKAGSRPFNPLFLQVAEGMEAYADFGGGAASKTMTIVKYGLIIAAYYNPKTGLTGLLSVATGNAGGGIATAPGGGDPTPTPTF